MVNVTVILIIFIVFFIIDVSLIISKKNFAGHLMLKFIMENDQRVNLDE